LSDEVKAFLLVCLPEFFRLGKIHLIQGRDQELKNEFASCYFMRNSHATIVEDGY
jgi:hypothetical protein